MRERLPVGIHDFGEIRTEGFYYVDKTIFIKELICNWGKANLLLRPCGFGKSLYMSMLKNFFETDCNRLLFNGLKIAQERELCEEYMGRFPVISFSLKGVAGDDFKAARTALCSAIGNEALRFQGLLRSETLTERDKELYKRLVRVDEESGGAFQMSDFTLVNSISVLTRLLRKHYGRKVIVLADDYDTPLKMASGYEYRHNMEKLLRDMWKNVLEYNDSLYFTVMAGYSHMWRKDILAGANRLCEESGSRIRTGESFGFTDRELQQMLSDCHLTASYRRIVKWCGGYDFGIPNICRPECVINICHMLCIGNFFENPKGYRPDGDLDDAIEKLFRKGGPAARRELEQLLSGKGIGKRIFREWDDPDAASPSERLWSRLYLTGYLAKRRELGEEIFELAVPNGEMGGKFFEKIKKQSVRELVSDEQNTGSFCTALRTGDALSLENRLNACLARLIGMSSIYTDEAQTEKYYYDILEGLIRTQKDWTVFTVFENCREYSNILVEIEKEKTGIVVCIKGTRENELNKGCRAALAETEKKQYVRRLKEDGMTVILKYGIAFGKKSCGVLFGWKSVQKIGRNL